MTSRPAADPEGDVPPIAADVLWLEPYPDRLVDPHEAAVARETLEIAFVAAIQHLPPRQRASLILRDVAGFSARETAKLLGTSVPAVNSGLQRARDRLRERLPSRRDEWPRSDTPAEQREVARRYVEAVERRDFSALAALVREGARFSFPPRPLWYDGLEAFRRGSEKHAAPGEHLFVAAQANMQPAVAIYLRAPGQGALPSARARGAACRGGARRRGRGLEPAGAVRGLRPTDEFSAVAPFQQGRVQHEGGPMKVGTEQEWQAARKELLAAERELEEHAGRVEQQRRELPWVPVEKEYRFATEDGPMSLPELFDGRSQLLIYHLMFGEDWAVACPGCSSLADGLGGVVAHLNDRDVTLLCMSQAPLEKLVAYKGRRGWTVPYVSAHGGDFLFDYGYAFRREEMSGTVRGEFDMGQLLGEAPQWLRDYREDVGAPDLESAVSVSAGWSVFAMRDGAVYNTYRVYPHSRLITPLFSGLLELVPNKE